SGGITTFPGRPCARNEIRSGTWKAPARIRAFARSFRRHTIHFAAIASREHQRFLENALRAEFLGSAACLVGGEGHPLAHLDGRGAMVQSNENDLHAGPRTLL